MKALGWLKRWEAALVVLLVGEVLLVGSINRSFLNLNNLLYSTADYAHIMLVALALTVVIITGGIDISVASTMGLASIILGITWQAGADIFVALLVALLVGALAGAFNGVLVANTDIQPLVITLGTLFLFSGIATGVAGSLGASGYEGISGLPRSFANIANGTLGPVPNPLLIVLGVAALLIVVLHQTRFGRALYLVGVNAEAARFSAISVKAVIVLAYTLSGLGAGLAGALLTSYFSSARSDLGGDTLLPALTAVVLGGASIQGGSGTVLGTLLASLVLGVLKQGLLALGVTSDQSQVMIGLLLISVVTIKSLVMLANRYRLNQRALRLRDLSKGGGPVLTTKPQP